jgi:hypothetical protein
MTLRWTQLGLAAFAIVAFSLAGPSARAFTMENLDANPDGNARFADPDSRIGTFGSGAQPFGPNGPIVQFGSQPGLGAPIGRFPGAGFAPSPPPPQPYDLNNPNRD